MGLQGLKPMKRIAIPSNLVSFKPIARWVKNVQCASEAEEFHSHNRSFVFVCQLSISNATGGCGSRREKYPNYKRPNEVSLRLVGERSSGERIELQTGDSTWELETGWTKTFLFTVDRVVESARIVRGENKFRWRNHCTHNMQVQDRERRRRSLAGRYNHQIFSIIFSNPKPSRGEIESLTGEGRKKITH